MDEMSEYELGQILKEMYDNAPKGEAVAFIHIFGIKYADIIRDSGYSSANIVDASGLPKSYCTEVTKGMKLSKYVELKN